MVSPLTKSEASVPAAVVATLTESLTSRPDLVASTYDLEVASLAFDGVEATLTFDNVEPSVVNLENQVVD
jgi:hypothetical protein